MNFPTNVKYTKEHEWIRLEGDVAYVGITDYAQEQLGDIVFVDIPTEGETLAADEVFGTIEVVKTISPHGAVSTRSPFSGPATIAIAAKERSPSLTALKNAVRSAQLLGV